MDHLLLVEVLVVSFLPLAQFWMTIDSFAIGCCRGMELASSAVGNYLFELLLLVKMPSIMAAWTEKAVATWLQLSVRLQGSLLS